MGTRVGPRLLGGLRGNMTCAEPSGGPGHQAAENFMLAPYPHPRQLGCFLLSMSRGLGHSDSGGDTVDLLA